MSGEEMIRMARAICKATVSGRVASSDDLVSECLVGIMEAQEKYDESKGCLSTYMWVCGRNRVLMYLRRERKHVANVVDKDIWEMSEWLCEKEERVDVVGIDNIEDVFNELISCDCRQKERAIAMQRDIIGGMTNQEVADKYGVSRQRVSKMVVDLRNRIKENYDYKDGLLIKKEEGELRCELEK